MEEPRIDPKTQFSKKLARWTAVFWFFYMTWLSVIVTLQPGAAQYTVYMGILATLVMLLNVWAYTKNSVYEKGTLALLDKMKIELKLHNSKTAQADKEEDCDEAEDLTEEGDDNG